MGSVSQAVLSSVLPKRFPAFLTRTASRLLGFDEVDRAYDAIRLAHPEQPLLQGLLQFMQITYKVAPADLNHIPRTGPVVIVANHPFGILEAAVLVTALQQVRPEVRILANELLRSIPELRELLIPVDVRSGSPRANVAGLRRATEVLQAGGALIVFPAGAVSHFQWRERASVDPPWHRSIARLVALAGKCGKPPVVVPIFVPGANSPAFHAAGMIHASLRTALLARELFNKKGTSMELRVGHPIPYERLAAMSGDEERVQYLRWRTYLLANRSSFKPDTKAFHHRREARMAEAIAPVSSSAMAKEVAALDPLDISGSFAVYLANAGQIPNALREIGRLREITFREAGEGTGRALDLDSFDQRYLHLFVWNEAKHEVVGAYRLCVTGKTPSLYTRTLFQFDERFLSALGPAVELGRSFVRSEYQKGFTPLLLLWKGIGKFIAANPRYKTLFGPVSISNRYQAVSRELMIAFLEKSACIAEWADLVRPRNAPLRGSTTAHCADVEELSDVVGDLEAGRAGIPVLLRQYLKLGGKLLGFNVDPEFSNALDGLIVVDLTKTQPKLLERYLGKAEAISFVNFHKENTHGT